MTRRRYDHRVRELIARTGDVDLFPELAIPRSTARSWIRRGPTEVIALDEPSHVERALRERLARLERRLAVTTAAMTLLLALVRTFELRLDRARLPEAANKARVLAAIERARRALPLGATLRVLGLTASRYHAWVRAQQACLLDDRSSCPGTTPSRLTARELLAMKDVALDPAHRHMSIRALALFAQRTGRVLAHPVTWYRMIRDRGWRRPRTRVHPESPRHGVRAERPDEAWHVDTTIVRLVDGTRAYVHAVIDNFSRRILAWTVTERMDPRSTCAILAEAAKRLDDAAASTAVYMDSGVENVNHQVDAVLEEWPLERILARVDVTWSNSMIEAWWRSLRHQWLYLNTLDSVATVRRLVRFYVREHNSVMPHSAFDGQTPDEMYFGRGETVPDELAKARAAARVRRLAENRASRCERCPRPPPAGDDRVAA